MRKLFYALLALPMLTACSDDDEIICLGMRFIDNSAIVGVWSRVNSEDVTLRVYENGRGKTIHKYGDEPEHEHDMGTYRITKDKIYYNDSYDGFYYKLSNDTLYLELGAGSGVHMDAFVKVK